ncbi:MAG: peptidylprolyl isomerase [Planctomycetota bacterium]
MKIPTLMSVLSLLVPCAAAQLTPNRTYYGIDRTMPMTVDRPDGADGELSIRLLEPSTANAIESADVSEGGVDLAALFPLLWEAKGTPRLVYAQLFAGETPVGSAVVLQPMINPRIGQVDPRTNRVRFVSTGSTYSGIRAYSEKYVRLETTEGDIVLRMRPDEAPNVAANFLDLVEGGYYTDVIFHRVIDRKEGRDPFVIQVGDPTGTGSGGPGRFVDLEPSAMEHDFGVISMARTNDPNSNGSQVFICLSRPGTQFLDGLYTAFGEAVEGGDAILAIAAVETDERDRPVFPPSIISAELIDAPPFGTGPDPVKRPIESSQPR